MLVNVACKKGHRVFGKITANIGGDSRCPVAFTEDGILYQLNRVAKSVIDATGKVSAHFKNRLEHLKEFKAATVYKIGNSYMVKWNDFVHICLALKHKYIRDARTMCELIDNEEFGDFWRNLNFSGTALKEVYTKYNPKKHYRAFFAADCFEDVDLDDSNDLSEEDYEEMDDIEDVEDDVEESIGRNEYLTRNKLIEAIGEDAFMHLINIFDEYAEDKQEVEEFFNAFEDYFDEVYLTEDEDAEECNEPSCIRTTIADLLKGKKLVISLEDK